jgi:hypothetical protein
MAAGKNLELFGFQFKDYRARDTRFLARRRPQLSRQTPDHGPGLVQQDVLFKRWMVGSKLAKNISRLPGLPRIVGTVLARWVPEKVGIHQPD